MSVGSYTGTIIGSYKLIDFVGAGGMGEVYRAMPTNGGPVFAVKLLLHAASSQDLLDRFHNEARIHAELHHPNIARMREFVTVGNRLAIVMEYVDGDTLESLIRRQGPMPIATIVQRFTPIADAVGYLHQRGIVHRDIKANNVKITEAGVPKLLDFGIAKSAQSPKLTMDGAVIGTLQYLSPEQLRTGVAQAQSDIWALGVMLYEMGTARLPFDGGGIVTVTERILKAQFEPPSKLNRALPKEFDRIVSTCLRVRPEDRYQSVNDLNEHLRELERPTVTPDKPKAVVVVAPKVTPIPNVTPKPKVRPVKLPDLPRMPTLSFKKLIGAAEWPESLRKNLPSGDQAASAAKEFGPVLGILGALALVVGALVYFLSPGPDVGPGPGPGPVTPTVNRGGRGAFDYDPVALNDSQTVMIFATERPAEVWMAGSKVGDTPYSIKARLGDSLAFELRRPGFRDTTLTVPVTISTKQYTIMLRRQDNPEPPEPDSPMPQPGESSQ